MKKILLKLVNRTIVRPEHAFMLNIWKKKFIVYNDHTKLEENYVKGMIHVIYIKEIVITVRESKNLIITA